MTPDQIRILRNLAALKKTRDMAALTKQQRQVQQVEHVISTLTDKVETASNNIEAEDLATTARWLGWAGQEQSRLIQSRQQFEDAAEEARQMAAKSDAKNRVINELLAKAEAAELQENRRRSERMGKEPDK